MNNESNKVNCYGIKVEDEPHIALEIYARQAKLNERIPNWEADQGIKWLFGYANYINQNYGKIHNKFASRTYPTGTILSVDFFGGFGNELIYDHPAIVLSDLSHGLIVAPLTSNPILYEATDNPLHIKLQKDIVLYGFLKKNSTIKLDQLRYISKKRIIKPMKRMKNRKGKIAKEITQKVSEKVKLNEIEMALIAKLAPFSVKTLTNDKAAVAQDKAKLEADRLLFDSEQLKFVQEKAIFEQEKASFEAEKASFAQNHAQLSPTK